MEENTKVIGDLKRDPVMVSWNMQMEVNIMDNGNRTREMDKALCYIQMDLNMKAIGNKINRPAKVTL